MTRHTGRPSQDFMFGNTETALGWPNTARQHTASTDFGSGGPKKKPRDTVSSDLNAQAQPRPTLYSRLIYIRCTNLPNVNLSLLSAGSLDCGGAYFAAPTAFARLLRRDLS